MLKKLLIGTFLFLQVGVCSASPLTDFSTHSTAVDINWSVVAYEGGKSSYNFGITQSLGKNWAANYRQTSYTPAYEGNNFDAKNKEFNLIYKISDNLQLYSGYSHTTATSTVAGIDISDKNVLQFGAIGIKQLSKRTTLFTIVGGGRNVGNVEFGLSYQMQPDLELTSTYRHLSVEKVGASQDKLNLRGFGLGLTWKW